MLLNVAKIDVWTGEIADRPGALAEKLQALSAAGANLEFIIARRAKEKPGTGVVFLTPLRNEKQQAVAKQLGFHVSSSLQSVRVEGPDEPGLGFLVTRALTEAGLNLRGLSAATLGNRFVMFLAFDSEKDADTAVQILGKQL